MLNPKPKSLSPSTGAWISASISKAGLGKTRHPESVICLPSRRSVTLAGRSGEAVSSPAALLWAAAGRCWVARAQHGCAAARHPPSDRPRSSPSARPFSFLTALCEYQVAETSHRSAQLNPPSERCMSPPAHPQPSPKRAITSTPPPGSGSRSCATSFCRPRPQSSSSRSWASSRSQTTPRFLFPLGSTGSASASTRMASSRSFLTCASHRSASPARRPPVPARHVSRTLLSSHSPPCTHSLRRMQPVVPRTAPARTRLSRAQPQPARHEVRGVGLSATKVLGSAAHR